MAGNPGSAAAAEYPFRSVDASIAVEYGPACAFIHHQVGRWCVYNKAEGIAAVLIDGAYWMYMSYERIQAALPWMSISTIRRSIKKLIQAGLLESRLRRGTQTERLSSPCALLYRALKYVDAGVFKMNSRGVQNEQVELVKLEPVKKSSVDATASTDLKDQTTSAKARSKEAAFSCEKVKATSKPQSGTYAQNGHRVRNTDGFQSTYQFVDNLDETTKRIDEWNEIAPAKDEERQAAIDACKETLRAEEKAAQAAEEKTLIIRPLPANWIRINEEEKAAEAAAQAAEAAEQEKGLIAGLRDLVIYHLDHLPLPQELRETLEAAILEEYSPTFDGWDIDALNAWVKQLLAIQTKLKPQLKAVTVAEAAG